MAVEYRAGEVYCGADKVDVSDPTPTQSRLLDELENISVGEPGALSSNDPWAVEIFEQLEILQDQRPLHENNND